MWVSSEGELYESKMDYFLEQHDDSTYAPEGIGGYSEEVNICSISLMYEKKLPIKLLQRNQKSVSNTEKYVCETCHSRPNNK